MKFNVNIVEKYTIFSQDDFLSEIMYLTKDSSGFPASKLKIGYPQPHN